MDAFTVRGYDDTFNLPELEMLEHLPQAHDQSALHTGLHGVLLVEAVLKAHQLLQQARHALVHILVEHLVTVAGGGGTVNIHAASAALEHALH